MKKNIICETCGRERTVDWRENRQTRFCSRKCIRNETQFKKGDRVRLGKKPARTAWDNPNSMVSRFKPGHTFGFTKGFTPWNKGLEYGVTERFRAKIMNLQLYRNWKRDIKERDGQCVKCDSEENLEADHYPKMFSEIIREFKIKTAEEARHCEELWNLDNGRTLCRDCHKQTDTYGKNI